MMETLVAGAAQAGIRLDDSQQAAFRLYFELLEERGRVVNLTAVKGWERVRDELFLRSLRMVSAPGSPLRVVGACRADVPMRNLVDVGAGAGIPGLVLKIAIPRLAVTLLDATRKKTDFLAHAARIMGLDGVTVVNARAEEAAHAEAHRESYDFVTARALGELSEVAELTLPLCKVNGEVLVLKQAGIQEEIAAAGYAADVLGAAPARAAPVDSPGPAGQDTLVVWRKARPTPARFPRRAGVPHRRPLRPVATGSGPVKARPS